MAKTHLARHRRPREGANERANCTVPNSHTRHAAGDIDARPRYDAHQAHYREADPGGGGWFRNTADIGYRWRRALKGGFRKGESPREEANNERSNRCGEEGGKEGAACRDGGLKDGGRNGG